MPSAESLATCESRSRTSRSVPAASCLRKVLSYAARTVTAPARHGRDRDERPYEDGRLILRDSRRLAWRRWGHPTHPTVLRIQGTPGSRLHRHPDPTLWASALDSLGLERVPVLSFSGGGPHALALAATHPDRVSAVTRAGRSCSTECSRTPPPCRLQPSISGGSRPRMERAS